MSNNKKINFYQVYRHLNKNLMHIASKYIYIAIKQW